MLATYNTKQGKPMMIPDGPILFYYIHGLAIMWSKTCKWKQPHCKKCEVIQKQHRYIGCMCIIKQPKSLSLISGKTEKTLDLYTAPFFVPLIIFYNTYVGSQSSAPKRFYRHIALSNQSWCFWLTCGTFITVHKNIPHSSSSVICKVRTHINLFICSSPFFKNLMYTDRFIINFYI